MALLVGTMNTPWAIRVAVVLARQAALATAVVAAMALVAVALVLAVARVAVVAALACARPRRVLVVAVGGTRLRRCWLQRTRLTAPLAAAMRHWLHDAPLAASTLSFHTHKSSRKG